MYREFLKLGNKYAYKLPRSPDKKERHETSDNKRGAVVRIVRNKGQTLDLIQLD